MNIKHIGCCFILLLLVGAAETRAQFDQNVRRSLFSDRKALQVGDAVTIFVSEDIAADNSATTTESSDTDLNAGFDLNSGSNPSGLDLGVNSGNDFRGRGQSTRAESFRARLSARVISVDENGNLQIEGIRTTKINNETQKITITGYVRPADIRPDNSVFSYNISKLTLIYEGDGNITKAQEPGLITKFLRILF